MSGVSWPMKFGDGRLAFDKLHSGTFIAGAAALSAAVWTCVTRRIPRTLAPDFPAEITPQPRLMIPLPRTGSPPLRIATLLSVVLALALTVVLAACGSDEPSGVTGPDRTASTPTETPASPARTSTTTGSGAAPTATDAPRPTATKAPTAHHWADLGGNGPGSPGCRLQRNGR